MLFYNHSSPFQTESGILINNLVVAYHKYGKLSNDADNVVWICHALTANSDAADWWPGMVGEDKYFDPEKYLIVCANVLGSCYGTTGPLSENPVSGKQWLHDFPAITIRDIVKVNDLLREHLGIQKIRIVIGGSIGGFQAMEWSIMKPDLFDYQVLIACSAKASPWVIAFNESQRMAMMADETFRKGFDGAFLAKADDGIEGLKAARSIALLSYRTSEAYNLTQKESSDEILEGYRAVSYQQHQGNKLVKRFNAYSYYVLTRFIDSHNIFRERPYLLDQLSTLKTHTIVIGISTDILYPVSEQKYLASIFPNSDYKEIYSDFGHDGFLIECDELTRILKETVE
ncbi:MAG TPA: homoserine O-acetyltransferase [Lentimicrobium sp.]|nr:homoserine O-acetyltransferase [Lentimicrobium sp.]